MDRADGSNTTDASEQAVGGGEDVRAFDSIDDALAAFTDGIDEAEDEQPEDLEAQSDDDQAEDEDADDEGDDEDEAVDEDDEDDQEEDSEARVVALPTGEEVSEQELIDGYYRQKDYTTKTQALAEQRKQVEQIEQRYREGAQSLLTLYDNAAQFLGNLVPPEPDVRLAQSDPGEYIRQKALYDSSVQEMQQFLSGSQQAQKAVMAMTDQEKAAIRESETAKLMEALPDLKEPARLAAFYQANEATAAEFGFSAEEIADVSDARVLQLVHYARIGKRAAAARAPAKQKLAEAPRKGQQPKRNTKTRNRTREAMQRLSQTGSLDDAMNINF